MASAKDKVHVQGQAFPKRHATVPQLWITLQVPLSSRVSEGWIESLLELYSNRAPLGIHPYRQCLQEYCSASFLLASQCMPVTLACSMNLVWWQVVSADTLSCSCWCILMIGSIECTLKYKGTGHFKCLELCTAVFLGSYALRDIPSHSLGIPEFK